MSFAQFADGFSHSRPDFNPGQAADLFEEFVNDWITGGFRHRGFASNSDMLEGIAAMYRCIGIPAGVQSTQGYSQGDYAEVLVVLTPEWVKKVGSPALTDPEAAKRAITAAAELWGDWAWGNVYGYTITDPDGEDTDASCWGFYGDDGSDYMIEEAKAEIDHMADERLIQLAHICEAARPDLYSGGS